MIFSILKLRNSCMAIIIVVFGRLFQESSNSHTHNTRNSVQTNYETCGQRSIMFYGLKIWNEISLSIKMFSDKTFNKQFKLFVFFIIINNIYYSLTSSSFFIIRLYYLQINVKSPRTIYMKEHSKLLVALYVP